VNSPFRLAILSLSSSEKDVIGASGHFLSPVVTELFFPLVPNMLPDMDRSLCRLFFSIIFIASAEPPSFVFSEKKMISHSSLVVEIFSLFTSGLC